MKKQRQPSQGSLMAKAARKKDKAINDVDAYAPLIKKQIPAQARLFPRGDNPACDFAALLDEARTVFDPKQLALDEWEH